MRLSDCDTDHDVVGVLLLDIVRVLVCVVLVFGDKVVVALELAVLVTEAVPVALLDALTVTEFDCVVDVVGVEVWVSVLFSVGEDVKRSVEVAEDSSDIDTLDECRPLSVGVTRIDAVSVRSFEACGVSDADLLHRFFVHIWDLGPH